jgi:hypothetical protein
MFTRGQLGVPPKTHVVYIMTSLCEDLKISYILGRKLCSKSCVNMETSWKIT